MGKSKITKISLEDSTGGDRLFRHHPRLAEPSAYLQQLLQQEAHLPSEHFAQELQLLEHPWQLLQALSAAVAVARPSPAMRASMAPALINVFMCVVCFVQSGKDSRSISNSPHKAKSPREFPRAPKKLNSLPEQKLIQIQQEPLRSGQSRLMALGQESGRARLREWH